MIPATKLLGCSDFNATDGFRIGRSEKHVGIEVGAWRLALRIQEGRFPKLDQIVPSGSAVKSTLEFTDDDAQFLCNAIPRLPCHDGVHMPLTLDLNGKVLVRCREAETARPSYAANSSSKSAGWILLKLGASMYFDWLNMRAWICVVRVAIRFAVCHDILDFRARVLATLAVSIPPWVI